MTLGLINALCASTHLVVPFVLDILSAERVGLFLRTLKRMRGPLFSDLELAGVVGTMKGDGTQRLRDAEQEALAEAERGTQHWGNANYVLKDVLIPRKQAIAEVAGVEVHSEVVKIFEPLGERIFALTCRNQPHGQPTVTPRLQVQRGARHAGQFDTSCPS
jgi:chromosome partitioning protein